MQGTSLELYETLYLVRRSEEYIIRHYPEDEMKTPMHMSMGQEAIPVGVCHALGDACDVFASYRSHATFLARTGDVDGFFAELFGRVTGTAGGKAGSMHLADIEKGHLCSTAIVGSGIPVALGAAFAHKKNGTGRHVVTFFGDGALDEGTFWESLNVACAMRIPVLFVCEDNGWAVHTDKETRHGYRSIARVVEQFECDGVEDDSNDVERICEITREAARKSAVDSRPAFLRFECLRYLEHVGIHEDFHEGYRPEQRYRDYQNEKDALALQRRRLLKDGHDENGVAALEAKVDARIQQAVSRARQAPLPEGDRLYSGVYHEKN